jgi:hypothetical protein
MPLTSLRVLRDDARKRIEAKVKEGREIRNSMDSFLLSQGDLDSARLKMENWVQYVKDLLETLFHNGSVVEQFAPSGGYVEIGGVPNFREQVEEFLKSMDGYVHRLESILQRLDLAREADKREATGVTLVQTPQRIYSMTEIEDAERTRQSSSERLKKSDYLGVFRDAQNAVELATKALLKFLDIEYPNVHDVSDKIPIAIRKLGKQMEPTKYVVARMELARAALWLHMLCAAKDYFFGIKDVGVPAGDIFHVELGTLAAACVNTTDIVVTNLNRLILQLVGFNEK